jgi:hypothetical protein
MKFDRCARWLGTATVLLGLSGYAESPQLLQAGRWEITIENELPNRTSPVKYLTCIEPGPAERPEPPRGKPSDPCQSTHGGVSGKVLSYGMKCGEKRSSEVRITYAGDRYEGVIESTQPEGKLRQIIRARRIGSCDDPLPAEQR